MNWTLRHKIATGLFSVVVIVASFSSVAFIAFSCLSSLDATEFNVSMALPDGTPLHITQEEAIQVDGILREHPAVEDVAASSSANDSAYAEKEISTIVRGQGATLYAAPSDQIMESLPSGTVLTASGRSTDDR